MILGISMARRDETYAVAALLMLLVLVVSGATGGLVYHATSGIRDRRGGWIIFGWAVTALAPLAVVTGLGRVLIAPFARVSPEADRLELFTSVPAVLALAIAAVLLAVQFMNVLGPGGSARRAEKSGDPDLARQVLWIALAMIFSTGIHVLDEPLRLTLPESPADAETLLERAETHARLRPEDAHAQLALGLTLLELGRFSEAEPLLRRAAELAPDRTHALNALGWVLNRQERFAEAVEPLREATRRNGKYGNAHQNLGWAWMHLGRMDDAEGAYAQAVRHLPRNGWAALEYSWVLQARGKADAALRHALRAAELLPDEPRSHVAAASLLEDLGRLEEAKEHLDAALRVDAKLPAVWAQLGATRFMLGDAAGAAAAFAEAQRLSPTFFSEGSAELGMWEAARRGSTDGTVESSPDLRRQADDGVDR